MKRKAFYCICIAAPITFVGAVLALWKCRRKRRYIVREPHGGRNPLPHDKRYGLLRRYIVCFYPEM